MSDLWARLKQRKLVQWALAYAAAAFALLQGLDIVAHQFGWTDRLQRAVTLVLILGFALTLVLAWYHGERGQQRVTSTELLIVALLLALGGGFLWQFTRAPHRPHAGSPPMPRARAVHAPSDQAHSALASTSATPAIPPKSIAVLPFENLSSDKDNAYFADGMQDLILTKLADIGQLKVISRTSTRKYASRPDDLRTVGRELGVATVLEGSVQKAGNQVLINVQLIDTRSDSHLWAESYQRKLENVFGVEGEVAGRIAEALKARLSPKESAALAQRPTRNADAYNAFLKANYYGHTAWNSTGGYAELFQHADRAFAEAVRLDPSFALAYARWGSVELDHYYFLARHYMEGEATPDLIKQARAHIDTALRLAPDLPEAHVSLGRWYTIGPGDVAGATVQFKRALALDPKQDGARRGLARIALSEGRLHDALAMIKTVAEHDPRDTQMLRTLSHIHAKLGEYSQAIRALQRAVAIDPTDNVDRLFLESYLRTGEGDLDKARSMIETMRQSPESRWDGFTIDELFTDLLWQRDTRAAAQLISEAPDRAFRWPWSRAYMLGRIASAQHRGDQARRDFQQAIEALRAYLKLHPDDRNVQADLARDLARVGQSDAALALGQRLLDQATKDKSPPEIAEVRSNLAQIHALLGQAGPAVAILRDMVARHAVYDTFTPWSLRLDPTWDRIRQDPGFKALLLDYVPAPASSAATGTAAP